MMPKETTPAVDTQSPEFLAAVEKAAANAVASLVPTIMAKLEEKRGEGSESIATDKAFAESLAIAISNLNDQGIGARRRVSPGVIAQREAARARMVDLIIEARAKNDIPLYEMRNKAYIDEIMIEPVYIDPQTRQAKATRIEYQGVPNQAMKPANEAAQAIYAAYSESLGTVELVRPEDKLGITPGGLVVKNNAVTERRQIAHLQEADRFANNPNGLRVVHKQPGGEAPQKTVQVLGKTRLGAAVVNA